MKNNNGEQLTNKSDTNDVESEIPKDTDDDNEDDFGDSQYSIFLKSLDNGKLINHINRISQSQTQPQTQTQTQIKRSNESPELKQHSFQESSTPKKLPSILTSVSSDPFDDDLDINILNNEVINGIDNRALSNLTSKNPEIVHKNISAELTKGIEPNNDQNKQVSELSDSESESDKDESAIGKLHEFGDYKTYFDSKHMKQQRQDEAYVKWDKQRRKDQNLSSQPTTIFKDCAIFVNGHTKPSINEIHRLVILHGGKFLSYLPNKSSATHIICDRLTPRKNVSFRNCRVVKAQWIVDCVEAKELLDWQKYRLILDVSYDQKRLTFGNNNKNDEDVDGKEVIYSGNCAEYQTRAENTLIALNGGVIIQQGNDKMLNRIDEDDEEEIQSTLLRHEENILEKSQKLESSQESANYDDVEDFPVLDKIPTENDKGVHKVRGKFVLDARHPDFLAGFFANSRLHHLSMWKSDLRLKFLKRIIKENLHKPKQDAFSGVQKNRKKIIMHIDFDCFFATASCLKHPNLDIEKDCIVVGHGGNSSDVASCNYVARTFGIRNGMWLQTARKLCPNLKLIDYEFNAYEKFSGEFYNYLVSSKYFDTIFPVSIDEALVDATSYCNSSEKGIEVAIDELSTLIRNHVFQITQCPVSVGAGPNVLLAKIALRKAKPNGQYAVFQNIDDIISLVPVKDLPGFGKGFLTKLEPELDNSSPVIKDILPITKPRLIQLLGEKTGTKLYEYARGIDQTSIEIDTSNPEMVLGRKSISVDVNFGIRFDTIEELDDFFIRLAREVYNRMVNLGIIGSTLTLRLAKRREGASVITAKFLGLGEVDFVNKSSRLGVATNDWGVIGNEIKVLYRMLNIPVKELRGISISITKLKDVESSKLSKQMTLPFAKSINTGSPVQVGKHMHVIYSTKDSDSNVSPKLDAFGTPISIKDTNPFAQSPARLASIRPKEQLIFDKEDIARRRNKSNVTKPPPPDQFEDLNQIDWEMFDALPSDIRRELKSELIRRGILPEEKSSPQKGKSYLQQVFPSPGGESKFVRVRDSPGKSPSKSPHKRRQTPAASPVKKQKQTPITSPVKKQKQDPIYEDSQSYDTSLINQLPSSIKQDVLKDIEYKKKIQKFDLLPMRDKINQKIEESKVEVESITMNWISHQPKILNLPSFLNNKISTRQLRSKIEEWVSTSLDQQGPHIEDIKYFQQFLIEMTERGQSSRAILLIQYIRDLLEYHRSIIKFHDESNTQYSDGQNTFYMSGIDDWENQLDILHNVCK
ncbi:REV1 [Candida pseudojiufengensis]|uniref:REV1 n=1 Tax=Candida pseudojiufengensis TaxID=497109 RepID=UPI002223F0FE|nr:REV1 [Candida pseudojiufengensis]KAI5965818.1 REV1 [Candida pseudojiufengensis]